MYQLNKALIGLSNSVNKKKIHGNENLDKVIDIVEKILDFNKQKKRKRKKKKENGIKILTLKQMLERLPIALAYEKVGKTHENLLNEIHKII